MTAGRARAAPRAVGLGWTGPALRVDTYQSAPSGMARFAAMNPFHWDPDWRIPVPGQPGITACSLESVWQGLKIHEGGTDFAMFRTRPYKRPPDTARAAHDYAATRFLLGDADVDIVTARLLIYVPAYLHLLDRLVPQCVMAEIHGALTAGTDVVFYDWDGNFNILDPSASFSHSALLAAWFNADLDQGFLEPWRGARPSRSGYDAVALDRYRSLHGQKVTT